MRPRLGQLYRAQTVDCGTLEQLSEAQTTVQGPYRIVERVQAKNSGTVGCDPDYRLGTTVTVE